MTFGAELRKLRRQAGVSLTELAARVHYSKGYLSKVETGTARPNPALAALCDAEFGTGGTLTALVPEEAPRYHHHTTTTITMRSGLPAVTPQFIGRAAELEEMRAALLRDAEGGAAVCAVHGMAGVGKTTLAVRCAHRLHAHFTDGHLFLDLRGHTPDAGEVTAAEALDRFLRLLGVPGDQIPVDTDDRASLYRDQLTGRSVLIVLDNARNASHVLPLVPAEPKCRVLVTSRYHLAALDDAYHIPLSALPRTHAINLFHTLTANRSPGDVPDGEITGRIVDRCGLLPLAIRIAAARLQANPSWTLAELNHRLGDEAGRLDQLDDGERNITATFQMSYRTLPSMHKRMFGLLALHPGADIELHSAAALAGADLPVTERLVNGLHDAHLISQQTTGRYRFHDLLRVFASTIALADIPTLDQHKALARLLDLALHITDRVDRMLAPQRYRRPLTFPNLPTAIPDLTTERAGEAWLRDEWPNVVALCKLAGTRGFHDRCWQLAFALRGFFFLTKLWDPWITTHQQALVAAKTSGDTWAQATTANNLGVASTDRGDLTEAGIQYHTALSLFQRIQDEHGLNTARNNLAWLDHYRGNHAAALHGMRAALDFYQRTNAHRNAAIAQRGLALVHTEIGDYTTALAHATNALTTFDELGLDLDAAMASNAQGWIHYSAEQHDHATTAYRDALARSHRCGSTYEAARAETGLGNIAAVAGNHHQAQHHWNQANTHHPHLNPTTVFEARAKSSTQPSNPPQPTDHDPEALD